MRTGSLLSTCLSELRERRLSFLVFPGESIEARARSFAKNGGKYVNHVDFDRDVQTLSASARELQKKVEKEKQF